MRVQVLRALSEKTGRGALMFWVWDQPINHETMNFPGLNEKTSSALRG
jgi:hypothetical protein